MHIFDTCSNRITKGVDYYPLYAHILISYGTPDRQVSQILADRQRTESLQATDSALVGCQVSSFWQISQFCSSFFSPQRPLSSLHCFMSMLLQASHHNTSTFVQKVLFLLVQAPIPVPACPPLLSYSPCHHSTCNQLFIQSLWSIISSLSLYPLLHSTFLCFPSAEICPTQLQSGVLLTFPPQFLGSVHFSRYSAPLHALTLHQIYVPCIFIFLFHFISSFSHILASPGLPSVQH